jgi:hypothetical protein
MFQIYSPVSIVSSDPYSADPIPIPYPATSLLLEISVGAAVSAARAAARTHATLPERG